MKQIKVKLRSRLGESMAETLVALLVASLALMVLAGMITATSNIVKTSEEKMDDYYVECRKLATFAAEDEGEIGAGTVTITVSDGELETVVSENVDVVKNDIFANHTVTAYRVPTAADGSDEG